MAVTIPATDIEPTMLANDEVLDHLRTTLGIQYELGRELGRGGMGTVYFARERALDRDVAVKVLPPLSSTDETRERFMREARTAAKLTHPNIVPLYTFGDTGSALYYVMGFVDGESLESRVRREGRLPAADVQRILEELAGALAYAHEKGIVHRDIKPDNILIEHGTGRAMLTDFGIAKQIATSENTLTHTGLVIGTPRFMSPEQAAGDRDIDGRSDLYSLGVVGYTAIAGRPPFEGGVREILAQQLSRAPIALRTVVSETPIALAGAIHRCLQPDPAKRWPDAQRMLDALRDDGPDEDSTGLRIVKRGNWLIATTAAFAVTLNLAWWDWNRGDSAGARFFVGMALIGMSLGAAIDMILLKRQGFSWREIKRALLSAPVWWHLWWPSHYRRPGDVWVRLPKPLRSSRILRTIGLGLFAGAMECFILIAAMPAGAWSSHHGNAVGIAFVATFATALISMFSAVVVQSRWGRPLGLSMREIDRLASAPTSQPTYWSRPHVARFLIADGSADVSRKAPATVTELVSAIARLAETMPPAMRDLGKDSVAAARQLADAVSELDREIGKLSRDVDPVERRRLEERVQTLDTLHAAAAPEQREMHELYVAQLSLVRRLDERLNEASARRDRAHELLRVLWLQLESLRAQLARDAEDSDVTQRLRSSIADAERYSAGYRLGE